MQTIFISKIVKMGTSHGIVLPVEILNGYRWQRGDHVVFGFSQDNTLFLKKLSDDDLRKLKPQPDITY